MDLATLEDLLSPGFVPIAPALKPLVPERGEVVGRECSHCGGEDPEARIADPGAPAALFVLPLLTPPPASIRNSRERV